MKSLLQSIFAGLLIAVPAVSFAQSVGPDSQNAGYVEIIQVDEVAYAPDADMTAHGTNSQAANSGTDTRDRAAGGYGGTVSGHSAGGASFLPAFNSGLQSIYLRH